MAYAAPTNHYLSGIPYKYLVFISVSLPSGSTVNKALPIPFTPYGPLVKNLLTLNLFKMMSEPWYCCAEPTDVQLAGL